MLTEKILKIPYALACKWARPGTQRYDELVSDGNLALVNALRTWREGGGASLSTHCYNAVSLTLLESRKRGLRCVMRRMPRVGMEFAEKSYTESDRLEVADAVEKVRRTVGSSGCELMLAVVGGTPIDEIAARTGYSRQTVSMLYHEAMRKAAKSKSLRAEA